MRLGIFTPTYPGINGEGGIGTYTRSLALALSARGHSVKVLTPGTPGPQRELRGITVQLVSVAHFPLLDRALPGLGPCLRVAKAMRRMAREDSLDLVEFPNWEGTGAAYTVVRPTPMVVRLHTSTAESVAIDGIPWSRQLRWDARRERWTARRADSLVTHSEAHKQMMAHELGIAPARIAVVPHGLSIPQDYTPTPAHERRPIVLFVGRLERRKGTFDLLQAIAEVLGRVPQARFQLIGADRPHCPGGRTHAQWARENIAGELLDRVDFLGVLPENELEQRLRAARVFVAPSLYESFGLVLIEAMRWGTPVVATRVGGVPEVVIDGQTGVLVEPGRPDQLASAIVRLLQDPGAAEALGKAGELRFLSMFSSERMASEVEDAYLRVLRVRQGGA